MHVCQWYKYVQRHDTLPETIILAHARKYLTLGIHQGIPHESATLIVFYMSEEIMAAKSRRYQLVKSNFCNLVDLAKQAVEDVARHAFAKNLISDQDLEDAENPLPNAKDRASKLIQKLLQKIAENEVHFDSFDRVFKSIPLLKDQANILLAVESIDNHEEIGDRNAATSIPIKRSSELESSVSGQYYSTLMYED